MTKNEFVAAAVEVLRERFRKRGLSTEEEWRQLVTAFCLSGEVEGLAKKLGYERNQP